jgi:hypothetical protein
MKLKQIYQIPILINFTLFQLSCSDRNETILKTDNTIFTDTVPMAVNQNEYMNKFFGSKGIIQFNYDPENEKKVLNLLNRDYSVYCKVDFNELFLTFEQRKIDLSEFEMIRDTLNLDFIPFSFYPDYFLLEFEVVRIEKDFYEVSINDSNGMKKIIQFGSNVSFSSWEDYFIGKGVQFTQSSNPIRRNADANAPKVDFNKGIIYEIIEVRGDWVKIGCSESCGYACETNNNYEGWIKWNEGGKLIIDLMSQC